MREKVNFVAFAAAIFFLVWVAQGPAQASTIGIPDVSSAISSSVSAASVDIKDADIYSSELNPFSFYTTGISPEVQNAFLDVSAGGAAGAAASAGGGDAASSAFAVSNASVDLVYQPPAGYCPPSPVPEPRQLAPLIGAFMIGTIVVFFRKHKAPAFAKIRT